jgi:hypothetical protein
VLRWRDVLQCARTWLLGTNTAHGPPCRGLHHRGDTAVKEPSPTDGAMHGMGTRLQSFASPYVTALRSAFQLVLPPGAAAPGQSASTTWRLETLLAHLFGYQ